MPDCKWLNLLSINYQTRNDQHKRRQINKQTKQDDFKPNDSISNNQHFNIKLNREYIGNRLLYYRSRIWRQSKEKNNERA